MRFNGSAAIRALGDALLDAARFIALLLVQGLTKIVIWRRNARYLQELESMDPRLLKDVGYRRDEVIEAIRAERMTFK